MSAIIDDQIGNGEQDARFVQQLPVLLLKPKQAAQVLAISERTLWELTDRGEIAAVYIGEGKKRKGIKRYRLSDLTEWVGKRPTGKPDQDGA